ncbi:hypothetical protein PEC18_06870 [Paucibacter sp. O1-1]|nr:hypothetical protein [Paucibacter sp. O1-1]MDA3825593.1 hypothetical protein [Paucibacter sp. O1-1]
MAVTGELWAPVSARTTTLAMGWPSGVTKRPRTPVLGVVSGSGTVSVTVAVRVIRPAVALPMPVTSSA